jgi:tetratricopeptide (TPR) repeat protein
MPLNDDLSGLPTTLPATAMKDWNRTIRGLLAHAATTATDLGAVLAATPSFALGHAVRGFSCMLLGRAEMTSYARQAYADAMASDGGTAREAAFVAALGEWLAGRPSAAAARLENVLADNPRDALAMKLAHAIYFMTGRLTDMRNSVERVLPAWGDHPARGYLLGCLAFAMEETGEYDLAARLGRDAVEVNADDAWAMHAVVHVYDMTGRSEEGLQWLNGREASWAHCNNFRFHMWWHRALMHLDSGRHDMALAIYDTQVRSESTDDYRDIANAASLLARLQLEGVDVGRRWEEMADICERRTADACLAFADLHYMLALCGGHRDGAVSRLIASMAASPAEPGEAQRLIASPGRCMAQGLQAFATGEYHVALQKLRVGLPQAQALGGSHAQRDVFAQIAVEAALRSGHFAEAELMLRDRQLQRAGSIDGFMHSRMAVVEASRVRAAS